VLERGRARHQRAIGTAIATEAPTVVLGGEHYLDHNGFLSCTAAPIRDPRGALAGVLDVSCEQRMHQRHSLGLVRLSVQLIEKRLFEAEFANHILVAFHERPEYVGSLQEGLVAVTPEGKLVGANSIARDWMGRRLECGGGASFAELFRQGLGKVVERAMSSSDALIRLGLRDGSELHVQLRSLRPRFSAFGGASASETPGGNTLEAKVLQSVPSSAPSGSARAPAADGPITLHELATGDAGIGRAVDRARRILGKDIPLLVQGESGVGKELFAQAFHNSGPRADKPFVALNCAAVPETLIESELFGYVGGAFTGARKEGSIGRIQQAHGGTLFLDEIGDMPLGMQARLLRVLQERCVTPVGSLKAIPVDISLVCATHRVLRDAVARGEFREDLYYRVKGVAQCGNPCTLTPRSVPAACSAKWHARSNTPGSSIRQSRASRFSVLKPRGARFPIPAPSAPRPGASTPARWTQSASMRRRGPNRSSTTSVSAARCAPSPVRSER
jgi:transcriptional regulator of acetoin/glycerol metabolism